MVIVMSNPLILGGFMNNQQFLDPDREVYNGSTIQDSGRVPKSKLLSNEYVYLGTTEQDSGKISRDQEGMPAHNLLAHNAQKLKKSAKLTHSCSKKNSEIVQVISDSIEGLKLALQQYEDIQNNK
jgi:hypothetical protein